MALTPDGVIALSGGDDGVVRLWDVATGLPLARVDRPFRKASAVALGADGRRIVVGLSKGGVEFYDVEEVPKAWAEFGSRIEKRLAFLR